MKTRELYLLKDQTLLDSQTVIVDLDVVDPISYLEVRYEATNGATSCIDHQIHDNVSVIELVDGSDVLESLSMMDWQALDFYHLGRIPHQKLTEKGGAVQMESVVIPFGRYPQDPELWLDTRKFRNPQLRLSHAFTISATAGFATGSGRLTVIAHIIEEGASPAKGFLMAKVQKAYATAAAGEDIAQLPLDHPYRLLLFRALASLHPITASIRDIKLSVDHDRWVPYHLDTPDILMRNREVFGMVSQLKEVLTANAGTVLGDIFSLESAFATALVDNQLITVSAMLGERVSTMAINFATIGVPAWQTVPQRALLKALGDSLHSTIALPFGRMDQPASWLDAAKHRDIRLIVTQIRAAASAAVILQQLRR